MVTADFLSMLAGIVLSLVFSYVPGAKQWFRKMDTDRQRLVMLAFLALTAAGVWALACAGWGSDFGLALTCDRGGLVALIKAFIYALISNQATHRITPKYRPEG